VHWPAKWYVNPGHVLQGLARTEELVRQVRDLLANRVLAQLAAVARTRLADLPPLRSFRLDAFVAAQAALAASQATVLAIRRALLPYNYIRQPSFSSLADVADRHIRVTT